MIINASQWQRPDLKQNDAINETVLALIEQIKIGKDQALIELSERFDGFTPQCIALKAPEDYGLDQELLLALKAAAKRIEAFAVFQKQSIKAIGYQDEVGEFTQRILPIESMAAYIPGGRFPLMSTALMTLIPAKVAGCTIRVALSPSDHPAVQAAASLAGATSFIHIGGVQAIGAVTFGCQWHHKVDMVVGPGNAYVNAAKAVVQRYIKIDTLAGPSELLVIADESAPFSCLIADLAAQAEHDPMALSLLISWRRDYLEKLITTINNNDSHKKLLENQQIQLISCETVEKAVEFANRFAPEHLSVCSDQINIDSLKHYGSLFLGVNSAVAFGDYCSGPNHTLPTLGYAKQRGGLSVLDFMRIQTIQTITDQGVEKLAPTAMALAKAEGLVEHYNSIALRKKI